MAKTNSKPKEPRANAKERDPRFEIFARLYVSGGAGFKAGNAMRSAIEAGYDAKYARAHSHLLLGRLKLRGAPVLKAVGIDEFFIAKKIKRLLGAKTLRYNPGTKEMMTMENGTVQLGAAQLAVSILEMEPAKVIKGDGPGGSIPVRLVTSVRLPQRKEAPAPNPTPAG